MRRSEESAPLQDMPESLFVYDFRCLKPYSGSPTAPI